MKYYKKHTEHCLQVAGDMFNKAVYKEDKIALELIQKQMNFELKLLKIVQKMSEFYVFLMCKKVNLQRKLFKK